MKQYILIKADTNDGDYIEEMSEITDEEIERFKKLIPILQDHDNSFFTLDQGEARDIYDEDELSDDDIAFIENFTPTGSYGIHSIDSIKILFVENEIDLL
jgi:hypothetical protein